MINEQAYSIRTTTGIRSTISAFQENIRRSAVEVLQLSNGQDMLVNWGAVTTVHVRGAEGDDDSDDD